VTPAPIRVLTRSARAAASAAAPAGSAPFRSDSIPVAPALLDSAAATAALPSAASNSAAEESALDLPAADVAVNSPAADSPAASPADPDPVEVSTDLRRSLDPIVLCDKAGCLTLRERPSDEIVTRILALAHSSILSGHQGVKRTLARLRGKITWPHMDNDVSSFIARCVSCQRKNASRSHPPAFLPLHPAGPFDIVECDHLGPLHADGGFRHVLVLVDRYSRFVHLVPTKGTTAQETADALLNSWISIHGPPRQLVCDGGPAFASDLLASLTSRLGVDLHIGTPHAPTGHGCVERVNRVLGDVIRSFIRDEPRWSVLLPAIQLSLNSATNRVIGMSPFEALFGVECRDAVGAALGTPPASVGDPLERCDLLRSQAIRERLVEAEARAVAAAQRDFARHARGRVDFDIGEFVLVAVEPEHKLAPRWTGPYEIVERLSPVIYVLRDLNRDTRMKCHVNRLCPFLASGSSDDVRAAALRSDEYEIDEVRAHKYIAGDLWLSVVWTGFPDYPVSDERSWVRFSDSHWSPAVKSYVAANNLHPTLPSDPVAPVPVAVARRRRRR